MLVQVLAVEATSREMAALATILPSMVAVLQRNLARMRVVVRVLAAVLAVTMAVLEILPFAVARYGLPSGGCGYWRRHRRHEPTEWEWNRHH